MKQHLYILLFLTGVIPVVQTVYRRFSLIQQSKTWTDAQTYCRTVYTDLATIEQQYELNQIQTLSQNLAASVWIGLYNDVNSWRWSMGDEPLGTYRIWFITNPDNSFSMEYCGLIDLFLLTWFDADCTKPFPFVCFDGRYTDTSRYIYISTSKTWSQAQSYCRLHHTDLASMRDLSEYTIIISLITGKTWIGLYRDSWKWSDKTNFTTISWASGQPDNAVQNENCVSVLNGQACDEPCTNLKSFFCQEVITGQKQIAELKVQSDQDVNDPAVKAAMLDQIKQLLGAHGNITVKWREQPNGRVFNKVEENTRTV